MNFEMYNYVFYVVALLADEYGVGCEFKGTPNIVECSIDGYEIDLVINDDNYDVYFQDNNVSLRTDKTDLYRAIARNIKKHL